MKNVIMFILSYINPIIPLVLKIISFLYKGIRNTIVSLYKIIKEGFLFFIDLFFSNEELIINKETKKILRKGIIVSLVILIVLWTCCRCNGQDTGLNNIYANSNSYKPIEVVPIVITGPSRLAIGEAELFSIENLSPEDAIECNLSVFPRKENAKAVLMPTISGPVYIFFKSREADSFVLILDVNISKRFQLVMHEVQVGENPTPPIPPGPNPIPPEPTPVPDSFSQWIKQAVESYVTGATRVSEAKAMAVNYKATADRVYYDFSIPIPDGAILTKYQAAEYVRALNKDSIPDNREEAWMTFSQKLNDVMQQMEKDNKLDKMKNVYDTFLQISIGLDLVQ